MHYKDGTEAKVGDIVKGKGYNIKHEIIGKIIGITPGAKTCNCTIACVCQFTPVYKNEHNQMHVVAHIEYGQCDHFELVAR